jgi:hypothetical protein
VDRLVGSRRGGGGAAHQSDLGAVQGRNGLGIDRGYQSRAAAAQKPGKGKQNSS